MTEQAGSVQPDYKRDGTYPSVLMWMENNVDDMIAAIKADGNKLSGPTLSPYLDAWLKQRTPRKSGAMARRLYKQKIKAAGLAHLYGEDDDD